MHLASASSIASMRSSSRKQIAAYEHHIFCYIAGIKNLFPDQRLHPVHHAALHLGDLMDLFGPVHSRSGFFFERYINFFHRINTNQKLGMCSHPSHLRGSKSFFSGEVESTFMKMSTRAANLHGILSDDDAVRDTVVEMLSTIESIEKEDIRGFRLASMLDPASPEYMPDANAKPFKLDVEPYQLLCDHIHHSSPLAPLPGPHCLAMKRIGIRGVSYGTWSSPAFRDSNIIFQLRGPSHLNEDRNHTRAGRVEAIFQPIGLMTYYLIVREHQLLDPATDPADIFREFGFAGGYLCKRDPTAMHILEVSQVVSHFALTEMREEGYEHLIHVLPLDRVSYQISKIPRKTLLTSTLVNVIIRLGWSNGPGSFFLITSRYSLITHYLDFLLCALHFRNGDRRIAFYFEAHRCGLL
jgi:hypothetical protein